MNKDRRQKLRTIYNQIDALSSALEEIRDEEDDARDNMPENLYDSERYELSVECSETIEVALDNLKEAMVQLDEII